ncbi:hypothetical protein GCM10017786_23140 [Amycolatopsis deserti]|uniref:Glucose/Sorbosone dehydrogenase domain-containing protein n=1 Tax=Amycolatopsis deserti TaxID=185696 RepID=A0ABQ3IT86_9PSEU|nr:hypothetical protein GCM10017786_23140 [Amycolatopsis deserti]
MRGGQRGGHGGAGGAAGLSAIDPGAGTPGLPRLCGPRDGALYVAATGESTVMRAAIRAVPAGPLRGRCGCAGGRVVRGGQRGGHRGAGGAGLGAWRVMARFAAAPEGMLYAANDEGTVARVPPAR